jgi:hypothetical protein
MATKKHRSHKISWLLTALAIVIVALILGLLLHLKDKNKSIATSDKPKSPVTNLITTPQTHTNSVTQSSSNIPPSSQWTSSSSGDITLQQPVANSVIQSGSTISGTANVSTVQYILSDSTVGLIDQGTLNVDNGKFSGILQFKSHSTTGTLEVYYPNPSNGAEDDVITIGVNYDQ